jgi:hypothetical protein
VYPWCPLRLEESNGILAPGAREIGLDLFLPRLRPGCVVLLGHAYALMAEEHGDAIHRHAGAEEFARESVAKSVGMAL